MVLRKKTYDFHLMSLVFGLKNSLKNLNDPCAGTGIIWSQDCFFAKHIENQSKPYVFTVKPLNF
jgi:hypothetical protein